ESGIGVRARRFAGSGADRRRRPRSPGHGRRRDPGVLLMRLKLGRPDIARYADRFDAPAAEPDGLSVTWIGVATLLIDDGSSALMTDGYFSRPSLARIAAGKV